MTVKASIIQIGNSRGLRLPKAVLEQSNLPDTVEIEVRDQCLIIRPATSPRQGWEGAFASMAERGDDALIDPGAGGTGWDQEEWQW